MEQKPERAIINITNIFISFDAIFRGREKEEKRENFP